MDDLIETGIELTAKQIRELDEINADKNAINATLNVALKFHANRMNETSKKEADWWKDIFERGSLDLSTGQYQVSVTGAIARIVKVKQ